MPDNIMVVSDIDDTIKWSHIPDHLRRLEDARDPTLAFKGMPELYTSLANDGGAKFFYVTGAPDIGIDQVQLDSIPRSVVLTNHFPVVDPVRDIYLHKLGEKTEDFKVATITEIMKGHPGVDFILIGDNGEKDVETYERLRQDSQLGSRVKEVFIHKLYEGGNSLPLKPGQRAFVTAADLAAILYGLNLLIRQ